MHEPTPRAFEPRTGRLLDEAARFGRPRADEAPVLVAHSPPMMALLRTVERLAPRARASLVTGPPGSGKAAVAALAFRMGPARSGAYVTLARDACGDDLARLNEAATSTPLTVVVPEVMDLSRVAQMSLLAALEAHEHGAIGEGLHVIARTGADGPDAVGRGPVRADLFYRLSAVHYDVPSLDLRTDDLDDLALAGLRLACRRLGVADKVLTTTALDVLRARPWPGNVRQLHNVMARAAALTDDRAIGAQTIHESCGSEQEYDGARGAGIVRRRRMPTPGARGRVLAALDGVDGNKSAAAAQLGISRRSLYRLLEQLDEE